MCAWGALGGHWEGPGKSSGAPWALGGCQFTVMCAPAGTSEVPSRALPQGPPECLPGRSRRDLPSAFLGAPAGTSRGPSRALPQGPPECLPARSRRDLPSAFPGAP
eukprot:9163516-Pyramimonas_sp.AAC.1